MAIVTSARKTPGVEAPTRSKRKLTPYLLLLPGFIWLFFFFVAPLGTLAGTATQTRVPGGEIDEFQQTFRFTNYLDAIQEYQEQFIRSFTYSIIATVLCLLIGYPLAYAIAIKGGRWRNTLLVLVIAPFFCSFVLRTIAWKQILSDEGFVVDGLQFLHILGPQDGLTATGTAVVAGITYNFLPFMILPLYASLERIDPKLLEAGADLYGNALATFRKITLPLSMPGVVAGTLLTFIPAAGDYVNAELLGNTKTKMLGNVVQSRFFKVVDYPSAAVLSFLLMAAIIILVTLYVRRAGTEELV